MRTQPEDVPQEQVDRVRDLLLKLSGYRPEICAPELLAKFEDVARTASALIIDEEKARHAETQTT